LKKLASKKLHVGHAACETHAERKREKERERKERRRDGEPETETETETETEREKRATHLLEKLAGVQLHVGQVARNKVVVGHAACPSR
jgi:hypothetical protein